MPAVCHSTDLWTFLGPICAGQGSTGAAFSKLQPAARGQAVPPHPIPHKWDAGRRGGAVPRHAVLAHCARRCSRRHLRAGHGRRCGICGCGSCARHSGATGWTVWLSCCARARPGCLSRVVALSPPQQLWPSPWATARALVALVGGIGRMCHHHPTRTQKDFLPLSCFTRRHEVAQSGVKGGQLMDTCVVVLY